MKKLISLVLSICMVFSLMVINPASAKAGTVVSGFPLPVTGTAYKITVLNRYTYGEHGSYIHQYVLKDGSSPRDIVADIAAAKNTEVYAVDSGKVITSKFLSGGGNYIVIKHSDGSYSYYGHLNERLVSKGATVTAGQKIGLVGKTGSATGYHLHFEWSKHDPGCSYVTAGYCKICPNSGASKNPHNHSNDVVAAPSISVNDKTVTISAVSGTTCYYSVDNAGFTQGTSVTLNTAGNHTIRAYAKNAKGTSSYTVSKSVSIGKTLEPVITTSANDKTVTVAIAKKDSSGDIYYKVNSGSYKKYTVAFTLSSTATVYAYAVKSGAVNSDTVSQKVLVTAPSVPDASLETSEKIAIDDPVSVKWKAVSNASSYDVTVYSGTEVYKQIEDVKGTMATFTIGEAGDYSITVLAKNGLGNSSECAALSVSVLPDLTVKFVDYDGETIISQQTVKYGGSASAPSAPSREGYTFQGWDSDFSNIKADTTVYAKYEINRYTVVFKDADGTVLSSQRVKWGESAEAPKPSNPDPGYIFNGWCVDKSSEGTDYTNVKGKMTLTATYCWENHNYPVAVSDFSVTVKENDAGQYYEASMRLDCNPDEDTIGRVIVAIQTKEGTNLAFATKDIAMETGSTQKDVTVNVTTSLDGTVAKVYVVGLSEDGNTEGSYANAQTTDIKREVYYSDWSEWSTTKPEESDDVQVESKVQYRYNTRTTATSTTSKTMSGYSLYNTVSSTGSWSAWQDSSISTINTDAKKREVGTQSVVNYTNWTMGHYCTGNVSGAKYITYPNKNYSTTFKNNAVYHELGTFKANDSRLKKSSYSDAGYACYSYVPSGSSSNYRCSNTCYYWYILKQTPVYKTQYRYRDTTYTYYFEKISDYSDWSDSLPGSYYKQESRTLYRYRTKASTVDVTEDYNTASSLYTGTIKDAGDLSGKEAVALVYKKTNTDPTKSQLEYVDQITIGEGNTYSVEISPRETISADTGDYVIALAVEGADRLINVDVMEAPKPQYTVSFCVDGQVIEEQTVTQNQCAAAPEAPAIPGKKFVKWDTNITNVTENLIVEAVYEDDEYVVVYVDSMNSTIELERAAYGDPIAKELPAADGYICTGWDQTNVTGDMIVNAVYEARQYTITFLDTEGNEVDRKTAFYGASVIPPDYSYITTPYGTTITGWSSEEKWKCVTDDAVITPIVEYETTVSAPYMENDPDDLTRLIIPDASGASEDLVEDPMVVLGCDTENATIYYTVDGTDPEVIETETSDDTIELSEESDDDSEEDSTSQVYTEPFAVHENTTIRMIAAADNANTSEIIEFTVNPKDVVVKETNKITASNISLSYSTKKQTKAISAKQLGSGKMTYKSSNTKVTVSSSGKITVPAKFVGKVTITIKAAEDSQYTSASKTVTLSVKPPVPTGLKLTSTAAGKMKAAWGKVSAASGYQIQYSRSSSFASGNTTTTISKNTTLYKTFTKLTKGKYYYVRVRSYYKTSGGDKLYSSWTSKKKILIHK